MLHLLARCLALGWCDLLHVEGWWKRLLELLCLLGVIDDEGVEVSRASDLELGLGLTSWLDGLLYSSGCKVWDWDDVKQSEHDGACG